MGMLLLAACNNDTAERKPSVIGPQPQQWFADDTIVVWNCDATTQSCTRIFTPADSVPLAQPFINGINKAWPEPFMQLVAVRNDTVEVSLLNASWLTGRSGNTGAEQYLTFAALNLLEVKGVDYVHFNIPRGAHAGSSVWSNADFSDWNLTQPNLQP